QLVSDDALQRRYVHVFHLFTVRERAAFVNSRLRQSAHSARRRCATPVRGAAAHRATAGPRSDPCPGAQSPGTSVSISVSQARAVASPGMRPSPRGGREPTGRTVGALGRAGSLNWLAKTRRQNTVSHFLISARE